MNRIYRYSRFYYFGLVFISIISFLIIKGFLYEAFPITNYTFSIILLSLVVLLLFCIIQYWRNIELKIIADKTKIVISKPFNSVELDWKEITEFGKYRRVAPYVGGYWVYYLRGGKRNKKYVIGVKGLKNLEDLVPYIIFKAYKAKLVSVEKAQKVT